MENNNGYEETLNVAEKMISLIKSNNFDISAFILRLSHEDDIKNKIFEFIDKWKEKNDDIQRYREWYKKHD